MESADTRMEQCYMGFLTLIVACARVFYNVMIYCKIVCVCVVPVGIAIVLIHKVSSRSMFVSAIRFSVDSHKPKRRYCQIFIDFNLDFVLNIPICLQYTYIPI